MKCPCYKCGHRRPATETTPGCHSDCVAYSEFRAAVDANRAAEQASLAAYFIHKKSFILKDGKVIRRK